MTPKEYIEKVLVTENNDFLAISQRLLYYKNLRILHALFGRDFDKDNMVEEIGDLMWYVALLCHELGVSFEEVWKKNIAKLELRYKGKFGETKALGRDLEAERGVFTKNDNKK